MRKAAFRGRSRTKPLSSLIEFIFFAKGEEREHHFHQKLNHAAAVANVAIQDRLNQPQTAATVNRLLDRFDTLVFLLEAAAGFTSQSQCAIRIFKKRWVSAGTSPSDWANNSLKTSVETARVHELSIAQNLVNIATEAIEAEYPAGNLPTVRVREVHLRLGQLAGVVEESLQFCYDVVTRETLLEDSRLVIEKLPIVVYCPSCQAEFELPNIQQFRCPYCQTPTGDVRQGKEMELAAIHFDDDRPERE